MQCVGRAYLFELGREANVGTAQLEHRLTAPPCGLTLHANFQGGATRLSNRWGILAVLFTVRLAMGFQFQSVAAVAPLLERDLGVGLADIGILIGLYFTPGVALALPGGAIGQKFGDKPTVLAALLLMLAGSPALALSAPSVVQIGVTLVAGDG